MNSGALKYFAEKLDWVLFDLEGKVRKQSENMDHLPEGAVGRSIFERFPLLDSMRDVLESLPKGEELVLPCIYAEVGGKPGWYDYIFCRENGEGEKPMIKWYIFNFSTQYLRLLALQQSIQEPHLTGKPAHQAKKEVQALTGPSNVLYTIEKQNRLILKELGELRRGLME